MIIAYIRSIIGLLIFIMEIAILIRAFSSWIPAGRYSSFFNLVYQITEPILAPIRRFLERSAFAANLPFDISPIIALLLLNILGNILSSLLRSLSGFIL